MKPARQRGVRVQPDGATFSQTDAQGNVTSTFPTFEVRLVLRYEDGPEREEAKREGFLWDVPLKEWIFMGQTERTAKLIAEKWQKKIDAIPHDRPAAPYRHAKRTTEPSAEFEVARLQAEIAGFRNRIIQADNEAGELRLRIDDLTRTLKAVNDAKAGLYKATCPGCGEDVFVEVKEAQRI